MLYLFHGPDISSSAKKAHTLIDSLRAKKPDAAFVKIEAGEWSPSIIEEHIAGQGLFSSKYIVFLDRVTENAEAKETIGDSVAAMAGSENIFIVLEGKLNAELKKVFEKSAEKTVVSDVKVVSAFEKGGPNIFALADAVGNRDSFKAWMLYRQTLDNGIEPENVLGTLFWQTKSITLAASSGNAIEAGLSPFVYSKSKRYAGNYSADELKILNEKLITLYHDGHRGIVDLELGIERMLLGLERVQAEK